MNWLDQLYEETMQYYRTETVIEFPSTIAPDSVPAERHFRRYYHTDVHVRNLLDGWNAIVSDTKMHLGMAVAGSIAIIYHDAVYDPTRNDNEERSAELMRKEMQGRLDKDYILIAEEAILQTKHTDDNCNSWFHNVIRDLDLRGLGGSKPEYRRNTWQIRHEYSMFTDEQFLEGRQKFLVYMLGKERIFRTPEFKHLEDNARTNIRYELSLMSKPDVWKGYFMKFEPVTDSDIIFMLHP